MDNAHRYFATTVALLTTNGARYGPNVMAAEWTMQVSYEPMIIAVFVHRSPTYWNILDSREFGINLASDDQAELVNLAGGYSGTELSKLAIPRAFETYRGKRINVPMIKGCALNAECRLVRIEKVGDHIMVLGKVLDARFDDARVPLIYTRGNYRRISRSKIPSGRSRIRLKSDTLAEFQRLAAGQFVFRAAACVATSRGRTLLQKFGDGWSVPFVPVKKGQNHAKILEHHMRSTGLKVKVGKIAGLQRLVLTDGKSSVRANFVFYTCKAHHGETEELRWFDRLPRNVALRRLLL